MQETQVVVSGSDGNSDFDSMIHYVCCRDENLALCGAALEKDFAEADEAECVVCTDLASRWVCPLTGQKCPEVTP